MEEIYENDEEKSGEAKCEFVQIYPLNQIYEILAKRRLNLSEFGGDKFKKTRTINQGKFG